MNELLTSIYYNNDVPGAFGGAHSLYREAKKQNTSVCLSDVRTFLREQPAYGLFRQIPNEMKRHLAKRHFRLSGPGSLVAFDTMYMDRIGTQFPYVMVAIDGFTKLAVMSAMKRLTKESGNKAILNILDQFPFPVRMIYTDSGGEFDNELVRKTLDTLQITHIYAPGINPNKTVY